MMQNVFQTMIPVVVKDNLYALLATIVVLCILWAIFSEGDGSFHYYKNYSIYIGYISFLAIILFPFFCLNPFNAKNIYYLRRILGIVTIPMGITWELRGSQNLKEGGGMVVANHQSMLDILGMFQVLDQTGVVSPVARKEVRYVAPFGPTAWFAGVVFIDRSNSKSAYSILQETAKLMSTQKVKLWMYPEGTRNSKLDSLLPFKKGSFRIAIISQVDIFPLVYSPYYFINHKTKYFGRGKMIIKALPPISTKGLTLDDIDELMERTRAVMTTAYQELAKEVLSSLPPDYPGLHMPQPKVSSDR